MEAILHLSQATKITAGIILLTIVTIESGGAFLLQIVQGKVPLTDFQKSFFRAGHAHAGVLVILSLIGLILADATTLSGPLAIIARDAVPLAAILMPAGFFFSAMGQDVSKPNKLIWLIYLGATSLAIGAITLGLGLLFS